jgi:site-specific recombinase XerD
MSEQSTETIESMQRMFGGGQVAVLSLFLKKLMEAGALAQSTGQSYRTAVRSVLEATEIKGSTDVRKLDVEAACEVFASVRHGLSEATVVSYQGRFANAVELYRSWLDNPQDPRDLALRYSARSAAAYPPGVLPEFRSVEEILLSALRSTDEDSLVPYRFPLRDGRTAFLALPYPLPTEDAERMSQFLRSLATDPVKADE